MSHFVQMARVPQQVPHPLLLRWPIPLHAGASPWLLIEEAESHENFLSSYQAKVAYAARDGKCNLSGKSRNIR